MLFLVVFACENAKFTTINSQNNEPSGNLTLEFTQPVGGELAMLTGQRARVDLKVTDALLRPVSGARLDLRMIGSAGGSTLSQSAVVSGTGGTVSFQLFAGRSPARFQVKIENARAIPLVLQVLVSSTGLVRFRISFQHEGELMDKEPDGLEVGIAFLQGCSGIHPYTAELEYQRVVPSVHAGVEYPELPVDIPFSLVVRGFSESGRPLLHGCMVPLQQWLVPDATVDLVIPLHDYFRQLGGHWNMYLPVDGSMVSGRISELLGPWRESGRCPLGIAQKYLDCLVSRMEGGNLTGCQRGIPTVETEWIMDHRGVSDASGCRSTRDAADRPSLEARLMQTDFWNQTQEALQSMRTFLSSGTLNSLLASGRLVPDQDAMRLEILQIGVQTVPGEFQFLDLVSPVGVGVFCPGSEEICTLEPAMVSIGWQNRLLSFVRAKYLDDWQIPLHGPDFAALLQGALLDAAWPLSLSDWLGEETGLWLADQDWERAFSLLGLTLPEPWQEPGQPDGTVSGTVRIPDRDQDMIIDSVIPDLLMTLFIP